MKNQEFKKIKKILSWAWKNKYSTFYRLKYEKSGLKLSQVKSIEDFKKLPYLERQEISESHPFERLFVAERKLRGASITSGTSGKKPLVVLKDFAYFLDGVKKKSMGDVFTYSEMKKYGAKRILTLRSTTGLNVRWHEAPSSAFRVFADFNNLAMCAEIASLCRADSIEASPTTLYFLAPFLKEKGLLEKIKYIKMFGEFCSNQRYQVLRTTYKNAYFSSHYISSEDWMRGWQCKYLAEKSASIFHKFPGIYIESLDIKTGQEATLGTSGECVTTSLLKMPFVVIRYKTGDLITFIPQKCKCGSREPIFEVHGKIGINNLPLQGTMLTTSQFEKALDLLGNKIKRDFKVHIFEHINQGRIVYRLEIHLVPKDSKLVANKQFATTAARLIQENFFIGAKLTLNDAVKKGLFLPVTVKLVESIPFEQKRRAFEIHYK